MKYSKPFEIDIDSEDIDCLSGDFNGDGFVDLIVASGGSEYSNFSPELRDRLYLNNGKNIFSKRSQLLLTLINLKVHLQFLLPILMEIVI